MKHYSWKNGNVLEYLLEGHRVRKVVSLCLYGTLRPRKSGFPLPLQDEAELSGVSVGVCAHLVCDVFHVHIVKLAL